MAYSSFIGLSSQFKFCGNAFRIDTYNGCTFGCSYCFANNQVSAGHQGLKQKFDNANIKDIDKVFNRAFDTDEKSNSLTIELLRRRVPLHCGGMADPFQRIEFEKHITKHLIEVSNKYRYPIIFSTKTSDLPDDYFDILNPELHAFQSSIIGVDKEWCEIFEHNTPEPEKRMEFVRKLRSKGFWCSIRIQPLIEMKQAKKLLQVMKDVPSYITIEHLKIPQTNFKWFEKYGKYISNVKDYIHTTIYYELAPHVKKKNVEELFKIANDYGVLVGCGDNDLHQMSQSRCCCGVDTIGESFGEWLKYNATYFTTGDYNKDELWTPTSNCSNCLFSHTIKHFDKKSYISYKEIVEDFMLRFENRVPVNKRRLF